MIKSILCIFIVFLTWASAYSADFEAGITAYKNGEYEQAFKEWIPLAIQGNAAAQHNLGVLFDEGQGVEQSYQDAFRWYTAAAKQGHSDAQNNLGFLYDQGNGVDQDYVKAYAWYNIAALNGDEVGKKNRDRIASEMSPEQIAQALGMSKDLVSAGKP